MRTAPSIAMAAALLATVACSAPPPASDGGFDSPDPAAKIYAIEKAARDGDRSPETLRHLVEQLDSDDPAVRLLAIGALERLTGENRGYDYADPPILRRAAIERWVVALPSEEEAASVAPAPDRARDGVDPDG